MLLPTAFLGLVVLAAPGFAPGFAPGVLEVGAASFEGVDFASLGLLGILESAALLLAAGFLVESGFAAGVDLGVSGLVVLAGEGRVRGEAAGFLAAGVLGLLTSKRKPYQII